MRAAPSGKTRPGSLSLGPAASVVGPLPSKWNASNFPAGVLATGIRFLFGASGHIPRGPPKA